MGIEISKIKTWENLEFLHRHKLKFDWDNNEIEYNKGLVEYEALAHPNISADNTGIYFDSEQPLHSDVVEEVTLS